MFSSPTQSASADDDHLPTYVPSPPSSPSPSAYPFLEPAKHTGPRTITNPKKVEKQKQKQKQKGKSTQQRRPVKVDDHPEAVIDYSTPGLRIVQPYYHHYRTFAKERWFGREILDVVSQEFRDRSRAYYNWALETGITTVNGVRAAPDTILKNGDLIENAVHAHEPAVTSELPTIIHHASDSGLLVISKPGSLPVHATGRYRKNTLLEILKDEMGFEKVYTSNRLDRLTSGIMLVALNKTTAQELGKAFMAGDVRKEYVARVVGRFPDGEIVCEEPMITVDRQMGLVIRHPEGKYCKTIFERMSYDPLSNTSIVYCQPFTGRTHQLRVHLQFLGHPIANDPLYSSVDVWGVKRGKGGLLPTYTTGRVLEEMRVFEAECQAREAEEAALNRPSTTTMNPLTADADVPSTVETPLESPGGCETPAVFGALDPADEVNSTGDIGLNSPVPLGRDAVEVIRRLRQLKDESDGWSRWRDRVGIEARVGARAPRAGVKGAEDGKEGNEEKEGEERKEKVEVDEEEQNRRNVAAGLGGYCNECFVPLIPHPPKEQMFIYLHATRYTTPAWEFSAPLPSWVSDNARAWWDAKKDEKREVLKRRMEDAREMLSALAREEKEERKAGGGREEE